MDFDHLLRKYLNGTISDPELEQLQRLLERVPEYKVELRQVLELRSLIHDDALTLMPPEDLSERTRLSVASQFAALEPSYMQARVEEERGRSRRVIFPFRAAAGMMVAAALVTTVALTPTIRFAAGNGPVPLSTETVRSTTDDPKPSTTIAAAGTRAPRSHRTPRVPRPAADNVPPADPGADEPGATDPGEAPHPQVAELSPAEVEKTTAAVPVGPEVKSPAEVMPNVNYIDPLAFGGELGRGREEEPGIYSALTDENLAFVVEPMSMGSGRDTRVFTVGVAVGSGDGSKMEAPSVLMQNSYYFSFNVTGNDRVGIEMGASTFGGSAVGSSSSFGGMSKGTVGSPDSEMSTPNTGAAPSSSGSSAAPPRPDPQVTYGAVYYDRRVQIDRALDLCGRVAFGGADNALMGTARAYAAYSPSNKVTLTLGVGGSALINISSKGAPGVNYGIYYGIETGF